MTRPTHRRSSPLQTCGEVGFGLGLPLLWALFHSTLFGEPQTGFWTRMAESLWGSPEAIALTVFLAACASFSFWTLGFYGSSWRREALERQEAVTQLERDLVERGYQLDLQADHLNDRMKRFHRTNALLQKSLDRQEVMRLAADSLYEILGYDRVNLLRVSADQTRLEFMASRGTGDDNVSGISMPLDERAGVLYLTVLRNEPILVQDMRKMPEDYHLLPPCDDIHQLRSRSFILCPISVNGVPVGLFGVDNKVNKGSLNESDLDTVRIFAEQVAGALSKIELLQAVELLTAEIQTTFDQSLRHRRQFVRLIGDVKDDTRSGTDSISRLRSSSETLYLAVDDTGSATTEISAAVHQVSENLASLNELMNQAIAATTEISAAARESAEHAAQSHRMADTVQREAFEGVAMVGRAHRGLQAIAEAMTGTVSAFRALIERTEHVGSFLDMIKEINQKTQLLSLNASILAAQAGEHGRAFAVVADQIHALYQETSGSAQAIDDLLQQIRQQAGSAGEQINRTRSLVDEGVAFGLTTEEVLQKITVSAGQALEVAGSIRTSSHEQTVNAEHTAASIQRMGEIANLVSHASQEQAEAITRIARQVEEIEGMAGTLSQTAGQQEQNIAHIDGMMDQVQVMGLQIFTEIEKRRDESQQVIEQLNQLKGSNGTQRGGVRLSLVKPKQSASV